MKVEVIKGVKHSVELNFGETSVCITTADAENLIAQLRAVVPVPADVDEAEIRKISISPSEVRYVIDAIHSYAGIFMTEDDAKKGLAIFKAGAEWRGKRVAAYIRECLEPEESLFDACPEDYTKGKIRGYKDILRDLEGGGLDEYMDEKAADEKEDEK